MQKIYYLFLNLNESNVKEIITCLSFYENKDECILVLFEEKIELIYTETVRNFNVK